MQPRKSQHPSTTKGRAKQAEEATRQKPPQSEQHTYVKHPKGILCENKDCQHECSTQAPHISSVHRHATKKCNDHLFCRADDIPEYFDKYKNIPLMHHEFNEVKKLILEDGDIDGYMKIDKLRERNSGWFNGLDEPIPDDQKLVINDRVLDEWLLAHFNLTFDEIPHTKPDGMAVWIHERLKKYFFQNMKDKKTKKRELQGGRESQQSANVVGDDGPNTFQVQIPYHYSPERVTTTKYPKFYQVVSMVDQHLEEHEKQQQQSFEEKAASRIRRKTIEKQGSHRSRSNSGNSSDGPTRNMVHNTSGKSPGRNLDLSLDSIAEENSRNKDQDKELKRFALTKQMSVKIPEAKKYKAPNQKAKDRLSSAYLKFLNHNEIEKCLQQQKAYDEKKQREAQIEKFKAIAKQTFDKKVDDQIEIRKGNKMEMHTSSKQADGIVIQGFKENTKEAEKRKEQEKHQKHKSQEKERKKVPRALIEYEVNMQELQQMKEIQSSLQFQKLSVNLAAFKDRHGGPQQSARSNLQSQQLRMGQSASGSDVRSAISHCKAAGGKRTRIPMPMSARSRIGKSATQIPSGSYMSEVSKKVDEQEKQKLAHLEVQYKKFFKPEKLKMSSLRRSTTNRASQDWNTRDHFKSSDRRGQTSHRFQQSGRLFSAQQTSTIQSTAKQSDPTMEMNFKTSAMSNNKKLSINVQSKIMKTDASLVPFTDRFDTQKKSTPLMDVRRSMINKGPAKAGYLSNREVEKQTLDRISSIPSTVRQFGGSESVVEQTIRSEKQCTISSTGNHEHLVSPRAAWVMSPRSNPKVIQSMAGAIRKNNEIVTSNVITKQSALQHILNSKFKIDTQTKIDAPAYKRIRDMGFKSPTIAHIAQHHTKKLLGKSDKADHQMIKQLQKYQDPNSQANIKLLYEKDYMKTHKISFNDISNKFGFKTSNDKKNEERINRMQETQQIKSTKQIERELIQQIQEELSKCEDDFTNAACLSAVEDVNIDIDFILLDVQSVTGYYKDFSDYRFWLTLSQQRMNLQEDGSGDFESAMDYLRNGLKEKPLNPELLFNYANTNERLGKHHIAIKFFRFAQQVRENWSNAYYGEAVSHFEQQEFKLAAECADKAIKSHKYHPTFLKLQQMKLQQEHNQQPSKHQNASNEGSLVQMGSEDEEETKKSQTQYQTLRYFQAMCYKNMKEFEKAKEIYSSLYQDFRREEGWVLLNHVISLIMLPLQQNRLKQYDQLEKHMGLMNEFQPMPINTERNKLINYVDKSTGYLNMEKYGMFIYYLLKDKAFFNRFNQETLLRYLAYSQPRYFEPNEIVFLNDQIGVITAGSVRIKSHCQEGMLNPVTIAKCNIGRVLGHESDKRVTTSSQTWIINFDQDTEILFFDKKAFAHLWKMQDQNLGRQIIEKCLLMNPLIQCLSEMSVKQIVFDDIIIKKYRPGALICRMSKRSHLNGLFKQINNEGHSKMKETTDNMVNQQRVDEIKKEGNENGPRTGTTALTGFMKQFTASPTKKEGAAGSEKDKPAEQQAEEAQSAEAAARQAPEADKEQEHEENLIKLQKIKDKEKEIAEKSAKARHRDDIYSLNKKFGDKNYKEIDGLYIIYQGGVDIVNIKTRNKMHQLTINEHFGDSKLLKIASFEYFGDLFASPNFNQARKPLSNFANLFSQNALLRRQTLDRINSTQTHGNQADLSQSVQVKNNNTLTRSIERKNEGGRGSKNPSLTVINPNALAKKQVSFDAASQHSRDKEADIMSVLKGSSERENYTVCFFLPYQKLRALPQTELKKMKEYITNANKKPSRDVGDLRNGLFYMMGRSYGTTDPGIFDY